MFAKVLIATILLLFEAIGLAQVVIDIPTRRSIEIPFKRFMAGLETADRVKTMKNLWPEVSGYGNYTLNELIIVRDDDSVLYHGRILFVPGTSEIEFLSAKSEGFAIWLEGRNGSYHCSFIFNEAEAGRFFIHDDKDGAKSEISKDEIGEIVAKVINLQKPISLFKPGEAFSINVNNPDGDLLWHKEAGGIRGSATGAYKIVHGTEPESMEVHFNFSYQFDSDFVKNWVEKANSALKYREKKENDYLSEFGMHLWESYLSELANRVMSEKSGFPVNWTSSPMDNYIDKYQDGNFVFVYEDITTKCRASALHERGSYSEAAMLYEEYARNKKDAFYLAWAAQEWVYAAEIATEESRTNYYMRALSSFSEVLEDDGFKSGIWLFEIAYGVALVNSVNSYDRDKGAKILSEIEVIMNPGGSNPAEERLRQKYIRWYR